MRRRFLYGVKTAVTIALLSVFIAFPSPVCRADDEDAEDYGKSGIVSVEDDIEVEVVEEDMAPSINPAQYISVEQAADETIQAILDRRSSVVLKVSAPADGSNTAYKVYEMIRNLREPRPNAELIANTVRINMKNVHKGDIDGVSYTEVTFTMPEYLYTYEEQTQFMDKLRTVYAELGLDSKNDLEKIYACYDYIAQNVVYDTETFENRENIDLNQLSNRMTFTPYSALMRGKSVCEGTATLLCQMLRDNGVDCIYDSGYVYGDKTKTHTWCRVKVDGKYYYLDVTWDEGNYQKSYRYFLRGTDAFETIHTPEDYVFGMGDRPQLPMSFYDYIPYLEDGDPGAYSKIKSARWMFADVTNSRSNWMRDSILQGYRRGFIKGKSENTDGSIVMEPNSPVTRGEFVVMLHRLEGAPLYKTDRSFTDIAENRFYYNAVRWAYENDIVHGTGDGLFNPDAPITRAEMAVMLNNYSRFKGCEGAGADISSYPDKADVPSWAENAVRWAVGDRIIKGANKVVDGQKVTLLNPRAQTTRAECVTMLNRFYDKYIEK